MESQREIERRYMRMLDAVRQAAPSTSRTGINCYVCQNKDCGHVTKTIDVDRGTTPFIYNCEKCNAEAISTFYKDIAPEKEPSIEWFRPTLQQTQKYKSNPGMLDHILDGGLDDRKINGKS